MTGQLKNLIGMILKNMTEGKYYLRKIWMVWKNLVDTLMLMEMVYPIELILEPIQTKGPTSLEGHLMMSTQDIQRTEIKMLKSCLGY